MWWGTSCFQVNLHYRLVNIDLNSEIVAVQIEGFDKLPIVVFASQCRRPNRNFSQTQIICSDIRRSTELHKTSTIWIWRDSTLPDFNWKMTPLSVANIHFIATADTESNEV